MFYKRKTYEKSAECFYEPQEKINCVKFFFSLAHLMYTVPFGKVLKKRATFSSVTRITQLNGLLFSINEKEKSLAEHPNKNKIMLKIYLRSLDALAQDFRNYKKQGE